MKRLGKAPLALLPRASFAPAPVTEGSEPEAGGWDVRGRAPRGQNCRILVFIHESLQYIERQRATGAELGARATTGASPPGPVFPEVSRPGQTTPAHALYPISLNTAAGDKDRGGETYSGGTFNRNLRAC